MRFFFFTILVGFVFLFPRISFSQNTGEIGPTFEERKETANKSLKENRFRESYELYMKLLREHPLDGQVNLGVARSAYGARRFNQAIMAYERLIESYPSESFLFMELASSYAAIKNAENAKAALESAKKLDPNLANIEVEDLIKAEEENTKQFFVNGNISLSYGFDSNANSGPFSNKVVLGNFPLTLDNASVQQPSEFGSVMAGLNMIWRKERQSRFLFVSDIAFYGKYYIKQIVEENNLVWGRLGLGLRYHWAKQYIDFRVKGDFAQYPSTRNITTVGAELSHGLGIKPQLNLLGTAGYEQRFYTDSPGNDGFYYYLGESLRIGFLNNMQNIIIGLKFSQRVAESDMFSNLSGEGSLRGSFSIPWDMNISPYASYRQEWYAGAGTALEFVNRVDGQIKAGLVVTKYIAKNYFVNLNYQYIKNLSNSPIYRYDQHTATISVGFQF